MQGSPRFLLENRVSSIEFCCTAVIASVIARFIWQEFMSKRAHVALIVETSIHYGRQILRGVTRYLRSHHGWSVFLEQRELWTAPPAWLRKWRGDGEIGRAHV